MTRTVALLGATGYTGRLVAAELARRQVAHRLGGRSLARLAQVDSAADKVHVDLADPASLDAFLDGADVLITCVGPFALHGRPAVEAAVRTGTAYVDSTGEPAFMREVYDRYAGAATPVVPACGFDYVPGDLGASVAAQELGAPVEQVRVLYDISGASATRGTVQSAIGAAADLTARPRRMVLDGPTGPVTGVEVPWGEQVTVPLHLPSAQVRTAVGAPDLLARAAAAIGPLVPLTRPLTRLSAPLWDRLAARLPEGPTVEQRGRAEALVLAEASGGGRTRTVAVHCRDAYGLTARFLVEAALTVEGRGAMATAQALDARTFLDAVTGSDEHGTFSWEVL